MALDFYYLKKLVSALLLPQYTAIVIGFVGVVILLWRRKVGAGLFFIFVGAVYYPVACMPITGFLLCRSLELRTIGEPDPAKLIRDGVHYVVVMGNVREGVDIWNKIPGAIMVVSSGSYTNVMVRQALVMGVPKDRMITAAKGRDTVEQAREIKVLLGDKPFVLSTWSMHMWRSLKTFRVEGLDPIPAPNKPVAPPRSLRQAFTPSKSGWFSTTVGIHEYVGTLAVVLRGLLLFRFSALVG